MGKICNYLLVTGTDWKVIPLENLIADLQREKVKIIFGVKSAEEAKLAFQTLETGADGVLLDSGNPQEIKDTIKAARELESESAELEAAVVTRVEPLGMGDRVCVDTCNLMQRGEGMLIGSQASGMFLVNSESDDSPYVAARPFRVNAGAVHSYIKIGDKTRYLSELQAGDTVTIVDSKGKQREGIVGRVKIESRPLMLIEAKAGDRTLTAILQNAETIKLVGKDGNPISVAKLKKGDEVLVRLEEGARHFGKKIEETIIEKVNQGKLNITRFLNSRIRRKMTQIGSFDLEKKAAVVAVILEKPLETSKKAAEKGADILEIRLDLLGIRDLERAAEIIREIKSEAGLPVIVTNRSGAEGGKWEGKEEDRIRASYQSSFP